MGLILVEPPAVEPISLQEAKDQLRVEQEVVVDDAAIEARIAAARTECERDTNRALLEQTWRYTRRCFPPANCPLELPKPPLREVEKIEYVNDQGALVELSAALYVVDTDGCDGVVGHVRPVYGGEWPITRDEPNAVRVTFTAGYDGPEDPRLADIRLGLLEEIAKSFEHREPFITGTIGTEVPRTGRARWMGYAVLFREF